MNIALLARHFASCDVYFVILSSWCRALIKLTQHQRFVFFLCFPIASNIASYSHLINIAAALQRDVLRLLFMRRTCSPYVDGSSHNSQQHELIKKNIDMASRSLFHSKTWWSSLRWFLLRDNREELFSAARRAVFLISGSKENVFSVAFKCFVCHTHLSSSIIKKTKKNEVEIWLLGTATMHASVLIRKCRTLNTNGASIFRDF